MHPVAQAILFGMALTCTVYFIGTLLSWMTYCIRPESFKYGFDNLRKILAIIAMAFAIIVYSILYYHNIC